MRLIAAFLAVTLIVQPCFAWSEGGHHLIAVLAFELLTADQQQELLTVLKAHPRFAEDFRPPTRTTEPVEVARWLIGRAGYWPDVARSQPMFTRPQWHYQLGATLTAGELSNVPARPGPLPINATMESEQLHIAQAIELVRGVLRDKRRPKSDRALAICWLTHLVADAHQPCHAGSLYYAGVFAGGDRGANAIPTKQSKNLHALWDGLLGPFYDEGDVLRRERSIVADQPVWNEARQAAEAANGLDPLIWLAESSHCGRTHVYTKEVMAPIEAVASGSVAKLPEIDLSETYLKSAGELARKRAAFAARRLARILADNL